MMLSSLIQSVLCSIITFGTIFNGAKGIKYSKWETDGIYKDLMCNRYLVRNTSRETVSRCAGECSLTSDCVSFFYTVSTKSCRLHSIRFYRGPSFPHFQQMTGSRYYFQSCIGLQFTVLNNSYIIPNVPPGTASDAKITCRKCSGNLITVEDQQTRIALKATVVPLMSQLNGVDGFWVSARFEDTENNFVWRDNQVLQSNSEFWYKDQPSYFKSATKLQKCVAMVAMDDFLFDDVKCENNGKNLVALCEII